MFKERKSLSHVRLFATPWNVAYQTLPSMGFSRQEYWSGLSFPSPEHLPDPGIEPGSPALQADALPSEPPGKSRYVYLTQIVQYKLMSKLETSLSSEKIILMLDKNPSKLTWHMNSWQSPQYINFQNQMRSRSHHFIFLDFEKVVGGFPGGPVVKTLRFHCRGQGLMPGQGSSTCCEVWSKGTKKRKDSWTLIKTVRNSAELSITNNSGSGSSGYSNSFQSQIFLNSMVYISIQFLWIQIKN